MSCALSKMAVSLPAVITLLCASSAYAADTAEVTTDRDAVTASVGTKSDANSLTGIVLTANKRETNLQKTSTSIAVMGIEGVRKHRVQR